MPAFFFGFARKAAAALLAAVLAACTTTEALQVSVPTPNSSKYAAIVVDVNDGRTLYAAKADESRYPASLAKMMTLYLLFEALDSGRITKSALIPVSATAAARPPSKLHIKAGQSIDVDTAIRALATKSANDVAAAVAEYLGGSEPRFAEMMTAKARQLGMSSTVFRNASGLPDVAQRTTARDMAQLALALRKRFPHHFHYFSARSFAFRGKVVRGHNDLLATLPGANGLKTGYTRASGFNIATTVDRGGRKVLAVVMGGDSAKSRNAHTALLIERFLPGATRQ